jgi:hypothetical protein
VRRILSTMADESIFPEMAPSHFKDAFFEALASSRRQASLSLRYSFGRIPTATTVA